MDLKAISDYLISISPVTATCVTVVGGLLAYRSAVGIARKNLFVTTVTGERAKWRQDLRTEMSELAKAVEIALGEPDWGYSMPTSERLGSFHAHRVAILLRMNPHPKEADETTIPQSMQSLTDAVRRRHRDDARSSFERLEASIQKLLKVEWDKSKEEARTGKMQPRDGWLYRSHTP